MTPNTMQEQDQRVQASAAYLEARHAACRVIDEHIAAQQRNVHHHGMIAGIRQILDHLEALAVADVEAEQVQPAVPERLAGMRGSAALLGDVTSWADGVTAGITGVVDHALLSDEADFLWDVSADILNRHAGRHDPDDLPYQRLSSVLLLEALIASPAAVQDALRMLRALLLEEDPKVAELWAALEGGKALPA